MVKTLDEEKVREKLVKVIKESKKGNENSGAWKKIKKA